MSNDRETAHDKRIAELERQVALLTEQCAAARRELEAFTYAVSHDLRAPLRSLSGFSQALIELPSGNVDPKAQHYLNRIQQAGRKMADLMDALLGLSRISRADLQLRQLNFTQLCEEAKNSVSGKFPERTLVTHIASDMTAYGDSRLLRTAMELLFDNAWKFTVQRRDATLSVGQQESIYFVRDNGAGFDMDYADKLFRPFQRLHADAQFTGIGIGLASVQRIIARHGGRVWAEAQPNQGTTVFFSLPPNSVATPAADR
jgi:light-regulated signal transduction histidine kinase (bacteriophytochrome)